MTDILFINPGNSKRTYQELSKKYSAIEPPTWSLLLAQSCRSKNYNCKILDVNAEQIEGNFLKIIYNLNKIIIQLFANNL